MVAAGGPPRPSPGSARSGAVGGGQADAVPIVPDEKDWTWVLERPCPECGFDASTFPAVEVAGVVRANAASWVGVLAGPAEALRRRPRSDRWSPLEYACHVRDVFALFSVRLALMLDEVDPLYPNWDQDATASEEGYNRQDPACVAADLERAAATLADAFDAVRPDQVVASGRRSDGAVFTVDGFARYMLHDPVHHLFDVTGRRTPGG